MSNVLLALALGMFVQEDSGSDWPQFLGPGGLGKSDLVDVDFDWPAEGPEVAWRLAIGRGFGGVSVSDGEVYLLDREVGELDVFRVLDLASGEELWSEIHEAPGRLNYPGSRTVPTVTEKHVYTVGGHGRVICYDRSKREEVWSVMLDEVYGGILPGYGWSSSALVVGDVVILTAFGEDVGLVGLNRFTGDELWVTPPVGTSHSTPTLLHMNGVEQVVFVSTPPSDVGLGEPGPFTITSYDAPTGDVIWETEIQLCQYPIPGAVQIDDERFFVTGGYQGGSAMMRVTKDGDAYKVEQLYHLARGSQVHNPILFEDHLYFLANENWNEPRNLRQEGGLTCLALDGKEKWRTGNDPYFGRGNWVLIDGHLVVQDGYNGTLSVVRATPEKYELVAQASLFGIDDRRDHQMWSPMAVADGRLLIRSQDELICIQL